MLGSLNFGYNCDVTCEVSRVMPFSDTYQSSECKILLSRILLSQFGFFQQQFEPHQQQDQEQDNNQIYNVISTTPHSSYLHLLPGHDPLFQAQLRQLDDQSRSVFGNPDSNFACPIHYVFFFSFFFSRLNFWLSVVYVGSGQMTENDTFNNSNVSSEFQNFANGLGWLLDSNEYQAYHNNNSAKFNDLPQILFYANHSVELLIHVSNLIPQIGNRKVVLEKSELRKQDSRE